MKKIALIAVAAALCVSAAAQTPKNVKYVYTEASDLTIVGKLMPGKTASVYHRVDTTTYKGFTKVENFQCRMTSGMSCAFKTNSTSISILTEYGEVSWPDNTNGYSGRGYNLYIKKDGEWIYAGAGAAGRDKLDKPFKIVENMDGSEHECLLYFPLYSEEKSIKIGVDEGSSIEALENPFRHRIAIWGSSYTHGSSTSRPGMAYPAQFSRHTGLQMLSLGCSGRCLLQEYFSAVLQDVEADAFVFDSFSNPKADLIRERLVPFIDEMIAAHPGVPMIFQQTIYREKRNFNVAEDAKEQAKMDMAASIFKEIKSTKEGREKYKDVYFIVPEAHAANHEATVDGVHPDNYGYSLWTASIEKQIVKILKKYGIK